MGNGKLTIRSCSAVVLALGFALAVALPGSAADRRVVVEHFTMDG